MGGKVIKHEFIRTRGMLAAILGIDAVVALGGAALVQTRLPVLGSIGLTLLMLATIALAPAVMFGLGGEHWSSSFKRQGYFTQSIPMQGWKLFGAKFAYGYAVTLAATAVTVLWAVVAWLAQAHLQGRSAGEALAAIGQLLARAAGVVPPWAWVLSIIVLLLAVAGYLALIYFAVAIGNEGRLSGRGWGPVVVYLAGYVVVQVLMVISILAVPFGVQMQGPGMFDVERFNFFRAALAGDGNVSVFPLGFLLVLALLPVPLLWRTGWSWDHRISLA